MVYPIVLYGEPVLEKQAATVTEFDTPELHQLLDDMFESMYAAKGVGLAAPQIGVSKKIVVIDCSNGENPNEKIVIFATYLGTVDMISREIEQTFPGQGVVVLRGGDLPDVL